MLLQIYDPDSGSSCRVEGLCLEVNDRDLNVTLPPTQPEHNITCEILPGAGSDYFRFESRLVPCHYLEVIRLIDINEEPWLSSIDLIVRATDPYGLTAIAEVHVSVYDINDHVPVLSPNGTLELDLKGEL